MSWFSKTEKIAEGISDFVDLSLFCLGHQRLVICALNAFEEFGKTHIE
jgi:hypothetical protein